MNPYNNFYRDRNRYYPNYNNDRFIFPFLVGAVTGGAAVGLTRPRPIYNVAPNPNYGPGPNYGPRYYPPRPYGNYSYNYYIPY